MMIGSSGPAEDAAVRAQLDRYQAQSKNTVKVNFVPDYNTALKTALAGGSPPDVFNVGPDTLPDFAQAGILLPIGDKMEDPDDFYPAVRKALTFEGEFYAVPKDFSTLALQYNVDDFEKAGLTPPTTWAELKAAALKLSSPDHPGMVISPTYTTLGAFFTQAGGWITNDDGTQMTADTPEMMQAIEYAADLYRSGAAATSPEVGAGWSGEAFGEKKTSIILEGNWVVGALKKDFPDVNYKTVPMPVGPAGEGTLVYTGGYAVAKASKNSEAGIDLIKFLTSKEEMLAYTKDFPVMPSRASLTEEWLSSYPDLKPYVDGVAYARSNEFRPGFTAVLDSFNSDLQALVDGKKQAGPVLAKLQQTGTQALEG